MKLKAAASRNLPKSLLEALNSSAVTDAFKHEVAIPHLRVRPEEWGPATHFVQEPDLTIPDSDNELGIEVTLSKVSVNERRSIVDFLNALEAVERIFVSVIEEHVMVSQRVQLFVVLQLDDKIKFPGREPTNLPERPAVWVQGRKGERRE